MMPRQASLAICFLAGSCSSAKESPKTAAPLAIELARIDAGPLREPPADAQENTSPVPNSAQQLVLMVGRDWDSFYGRLQRFERREGQWVPLAEPIVVTLGRSGLAWGAGFHEVPAGAYVKIEGDGRSPAGVFGIGAAYGYAKARDVPLPYQATTPKWRCVNDADSSYYNRVVHERDVEKDWRTSENMRRRDALYEMVIEIDHNHISGDALPKPMAGSCIFFHVWRDKDDPTAGCTAMERSEMEGLLRWLDPAKAPVAVFLPESEYELRQRSWGLPGLSTTLN